MKSVPSVLAAPWAIEPHWLRVCYGVWSRGKIDAAALEQARTDWEARKAARPRLDQMSNVVEGTGGTLSIIGNVGVIAIEGPLFRHAGIIVDWSGGTSYEAIAKGLEVALASRMVTSILLRCSSPGGEADGVNELAKAIAAANEQKPVYAYVDGMCASACYWLASQARRIFAEETSEIGSIGVRCGIVDYSGNDALHGIREIEIISSQSPGKRSLPVDDDVVGRLQTRIDDLADLFVGAVASGRGVSADTVLSDFGRGDVMIASKAVAAGLIDELGNFESTLEALRSTTNGGSSARAKGWTMAKEASSKPTAGDDGEWQCAGCNEMMGPSAKSYCAKCSEDDDDEDDDEDEEEAKALGLDVKASSAARRERMVALVEFERQALATVGATTAAAAIGKISAGALAIGQAEQFRVAAEEQKKASMQQQLKSTLGDKRLSLGHLTAVIPTFLSNVPGSDGEPSERKKVQDALAALPSQTREDVVGVLCMASATDDLLASIAAFAGVQAPMPEGTRREPPLDAKNRLHIVNVSKDEAAKFGMKPESFEKYANITSVDQIERPAQKQGA
jgi:ClpP class serine protease